MLDQYVDRVWAPAHKRMRLTGPHLYGTLDIVPAGKAPQMGRGPLGNTGAGLMAELGDERYQNLLAKHLAMNQQTWRRLQELGVTTSTSLRLDFSYRAPARKAAEALQELLADQTDYDVQIARSSSLLSNEWSVHGTTQSTTISPEVLDQWVDWMVTAGLERGCEFDGWGTET